MASYSQITSSAGLILLLAWPAAGGERQDPTDPFEQMRSQMVEDQIEPRGHVRPEVLNAMVDVPRHRFVPEQSRADAYSDRALRIGEGQTISQPYIVAVMTSLLDIDPGDKVLEIGTGSGYQAAVLSRLGAEVYTIEIIESLAKRAQETLGELGYDDVQFRVGDGYDGWPANAPFDGIIVTAAAESIPQPLIDQLKVGGQLVMPVGDFLQDLFVVTKTDVGIERRKVLGVKFVPMTGRVQEERSEN